MTRHALLLVAIALAFSACVQGAQGEAVTSKELLPFKVMYLDPSYRIREVLEVSAGSVELKQFKDGALVTVGSRPAQPELLDQALAGVRKDDLRGTVEYTNPFVRDGVRTRLITPLGSVTEYGVLSLLGAGDEQRKKWPQAILRLEPLFRLGKDWSTELSNSPRPSEDG